MSDTAASDTTDTTGTEASKPVGEAAETAGSEEVDYKAKYEETLSNSRKWEGRAKADEEAAKKWREHEESSKSEEEKRAARDKERDAELEQYKAKALRGDVADEKKIPTEWRKFLVGSTKEELEASADELLKLIADNGGRKTDPNQGKTADDAPGDFLRNAVRH